MVVRKLRMRESRREKRVQLGSLLFENSCEVFPFLFFFFFSYSFCFSLFCFPFYYLVFFLSLFVCQNIFVWCKIGVMSFERVGMISWSLPLFLFPFLFYCAIAQGLSKFLSSKSVRVRMNLIFALIHLRMERWLKFCITWKEEMEPKILQKKTVFHEVNLRNGGVEVRGNAEPGRKE